MIVLLFALCFFKVGETQGKIPDKQANNPGKVLPLLWGELFKQFPVAIISGTLEAYDSDSENNPVQLKLRVVDQINKREQEWIYNPTPEGGEYKMYLRPNRTYEINIIPLKDGYKEHKTQIYIPRSTYSYEFSRRLRLEALKTASGKVIATKISVVQSSHKFTKAEEIKRSSAYYDGLIGIASTAIERSDSENFMKLVYAGHIPDTVNIHEPELQDKQTNPRYDELINTIEDAIEEGNWKPIDSLVETSEMLNEAFISDSFLDERTPIRAESFHFDRGSSLIAPKDASRLKDLAQMLKSSEKKYILQINGYSDSDGSAEHNEALSKQRAVNVLQVLKKYQVKSESFILILNGFGSIETDDPKKGRRTDVNIFELP